MDMENNTQIIKGYVPLAELFGYSTVLRSSPGSGRIFHAIFPLRGKPERFIGLGLSLAGSQ